MKNAVKGEYSHDNASSDQPSAAAPLDRTRFRFLSFLCVGFLLSSGLALSVAYLSLNQITGAAAQLNLSAAEANSAVMTYIGASIMAALLAAFALIYALGRHMVLAPQIELRRSRELLRDSEAQARRLAQVAEKASDLIIIYDRHGDIVWVNSAFVKTTGFSPHEVIGRKPGEFLNGGKTDLVAGERIANAIRDGEPVTAQLVNYSKSGREYLVEVNVSPVHDNDGVVTNFVAVERDITERHMAEHRLRKAVEMLDDGFTIYDRDDRLVMFNRGYEKMMGAEGALRTGMTLLEVATELGKAGFIDLEERTAEEWAAHQSKMMRSSQIERSFSSNAGQTLLIRDRETESGEIVSLRTDVTELQEARRRAEEAGEAKSRFFANITHEVRTPLNGVIAMAELLLEGDLTEPQRSGLQLISQSGSSLLTIINDILDYSKIEVGKMTIQPAPFDVVEALEDIVALLAPEAQKKKNEIAFTFDTSLPRLIMGDHGRVRQIATNLIGNAIKFTSGGEIVVRLGGELAGDNVDLLIEVEDSGVGISDENLSLIFQPFEQMDGPMRQEGAGLGLSICRQLADLMDGELSASSIPDEGSTFRFAASFPHLEAGVTVLEPLKDVAPVALFGDGALTDGLASQIRALGGRIAAFDERPSLTVVSLPRDGAMPGNLRAPADVPAIIVAPQGAMPPADLAQRFPKGAQLLRRPVRTGILASNISTLLGSSPNSRLSGPERRRRTRAADLPLVLVAEDNATNAAIINAMLADQPMQVEIYSDGGSAVEAFERKPPAVVLMDIQLPDMTGYEATGRMRALDEMQQRPMTPVIAATASSRPEDQQACLDAGLDDFISKPLNKQQLCAKLTYWIRQAEKAGEDEGERIAG